MTSKTTTMVKIFFWRRLLWHTFFLLQHFFFLNWKLRPYSVKSHIFQQIEIYAGNVLSRPKITRVCPVFCRLSEMSEKFFEPKISVFLRTRNFLISHRLSLPNKFFWRNYPLIWPKYAKKQTFHLIGFIWFRNVRNGELFFQNLWRKKKWYAFTY